MLLSGIICDAEEKAEGARNTLRPKERAKRPKAESIDRELRCIRGKSPFRDGTSDCEIPAFWKYQRALMSLDSQWRDLFRPQ